MKTEFGVRQFQHQKAVIWNISFFAFPPSPLHTSPELQKPQLTPMPACTPRGLQLHYLLQTAPTESRNQEDKLWAEWATGSSKWKKAKKAAVCFVWRWDAGAMLAMSACLCFWTQQSFTSEKISIRVSTSSRKSYETQANQTPWSKPGTCHVKKSTHVAWLATGSASAGPEAELLRPPVFRAPKRN